MGVSTIPFNQTTEKTESVFRYEVFSDGSLYVFQDGKLTGQIESSNHLFQFVPRKGENGPIFESLEAVKKDLEGTHSV